MSDAVSRLRIEVESIATSDSPDLTFTAISPEGRPHSATVWFAPTAELNLLTFSSPTRIHARHIDQCIDAGIPALVSGGMRLNGQTKSQPNQHGITFEGVGQSLREPEEIQAALTRFLMYSTFREDVLDRYLNHPTSEVPSHGVYLLKPQLWTVFDARLGPENPDRLVHLEWPVQ